MKFASGRWWAALGVGLLIGLPGASRPCGAADESARVSVLKTPEGGIQPQAVADASGTIHVVYFQGPPQGGDLFYARVEPGRDTFSTPVRVNSQPGSAIAIGSIRGGQIALGKGGRVHVAWNGSQAARPKNPIQGSPMLYARSNPEGTAFEPQRNLMRRTFGLDGGGTVAADREGNVYVAWHGREPGAVDGEMGRCMWVARSRDEGATFDAEVPAQARPTGACACCGTRALVADDGTLLLLYRAAKAGIGRDMTLLASSDHGRTFRAATVDRWNLNACPMSSATLAEGRSGVLAAWETKGQVYSAPIDPESLKLGAVVSPPGEPGGRKHPAIACNDRGETLLAWTEGTGWQKGGALAWQLFDAAHRTIGPEGRRDGAIPTWGLATVVARPDGGFTILY